MARDEADKLWTVLDLLNWTARFFEKKEIDAPRLTAELLLAHVMGWSRIQLYTQFSVVATDEQRARFRELVLKRAGHCPVQYLLGKVEFLSREFAVGPGVLIPRPETELLVEAAIEEIRRRDLATKGPILDLGTGSGVIAVSIALALPQARLIASDVSADALAVAQQNAERHGVGERVDLRAGDLFEPLRGAGPLAAIVSNPPYVAEKDFPTLMPEVRDCEPAGALKAGLDGLECYRRIAAEASSLLIEGGLLALEVGCGQAQPVCDLLRASGGFDEPQVLKDFQKIDRVIVCQRR